MKNKTTLLLAMLCCRLFVLAQADTLHMGAMAKLVQPGAALVLVSKQFAFTEGPAVDKNGNIFFTDQPNNRIWEYNTAGKLSVFMDSAGRSNGMYFNSNGNLVACADEKDQLWSIDAHKQIKVLLNDFHGRLFNGPNDLWIDKKGNIYFTDPYYQRDYWVRKKPDLEKQNVYCLPAGKKEAILLDSTLQQPNGIVGTPDGQYLYVADIRANKTYRYTVQDNGRLTNRVLFVAQGSDGMTLDEQGNVYLTGKGITLYNARGGLIGKIPVPAAWTGNICFGGKDRKTLFITASEAIYTLQMQVKGVE